jgi:hypothetical protein
MEEITGRSVGQLTITHDVVLRGTVDGDAWVTGGAALTLYGLVAGNLHVDEGGCAIVRGTVSGAVINAHLADRERSFRGIVSRHFTRS